MLRILEDIALAMVIIWLALEILIDLGANVVIL